MSSNKGIPTAVVGKTIRQMIKDKYKLSSAHYNSLYLYSDDKKPIITLSEYSERDNKKHKDEYSLEISNIPGAYQIKINEYFYNEVLLSIARYVDIFSNKQKTAVVNLQDIIKYYEDNKHLGEQEVVKLLLKYLLENNCPKNIINRLYFFFDNPKYKKNKSEKEHVGTWHLNHENKLVKYDMSSGQQWFFVGEKETRTFNKLNNQAQRIFDFAEKAYQKQIGA